MVVRASWVARGKGPPCSSMPIYQPSGLRPFEAAVAARAMADDLGSHYVVVVTQILQGKVVPFLGAGANNCGRPEETSFQAGRLLPSGGELSRYLAQKYGYTKGDLDELVRVAEHVAMTAGEGALFDQLRRLFNVDYPPNPLHRLLAGLPGLLRAKGYPPQYQLIVTTNYDDVLERAFAEAGEEMDVFSYMTLGQGQQGKFLHLPPHGEPVLVDSANDYRGLLLDDEDNLPHPTILKIHGAVNRTDRNRDSYVITEDHYI